MPTPTRFHISDDIRTECARYGIEIEPETSAGLQAPRQIGVDAPARLYRGIYDVDLIGAFT